MDGLGVTKNFESIDWVNQASNGSAERVDPLRRQYCRGLAVGMFGLVGCGGGGGGSDSAGGGQPAPSVGGQTPPKSGSFGGGSGKILYVEMAYAPTSVKELDLASRKIRTVVTLQRGEYEGGVTRASNGTFALLVSVLREKSTIYIHRDDGSLVRSFPLKDYTMPAVAISPSGQYVVYAWADTRNATSIWTDDNHLLAEVIEIASGKEREFTLLDDEVSPRDKSLYALTACPIWLSDTVFCVMFRGGYVQVDIDSGSVTRVLDDKFPRPEVVSVGPNKSELWFQSPNGNPYGSAIWSLSLADQAIKQRLTRSKGGYQYAPTFSPDGQWVLMQQGDFLTGVVGAGLSTVLSAIRASSEQIDTEGLDVAIRDVGGGLVLAMDRMAWY